MKTLITKQLLINSDAVATQIFCEKMNCLFDILHFNVFRNPNPYKKYLTIGSISYSTLIELQAWLKTWIILDKHGIDVSRRFPCVKGWLQAISGILILLHDLAKDPNFKFLITRNLCQDRHWKFLLYCLCGGGWNDRPNCSQFIN